MKKIIKMLGVILAMSLALTGTAFASELSFDTMVDWNIKIAIPDYTISVYTEGNYYIYTQEQGRIPYVMIRTYTDFEDEDDFINGYFTDYMSGQYADLEIVESFGPVYVESRLFYEIEYSYTIQGYQCRDIRLIKTVDGITYMFASKEVDELDMTLDTQLQWVAANSVFLRDGEPIDESELSGDEGYSDIPAVNWEDVKGELESSDLKGEFIAFDEVGFEMFVPDFLKESPLPEGQPMPETFLGFYVSDDGEAYASVQYVPTNRDMDWYREFLESNSIIESVADFLVNGVPFLFYEIPDNDVMCLATFVNNGLLEFAFYPLSDGLGEIMGASIREVK